MTDLTRYPLTGDFRDTVRALLSGVTDASLDHLTKRLCGIEGDEDVREAV